MKTPAEIKEYLKKQLWYNEFVSNIKEYHNDDPDMINSILNGYKGNDTILCAFYWPDYNSNLDWLLINDAFVEWYNS